MSTETGFQQEGYGGIALPPQFFANQDRRTKVKWSVNGDYLPSMPVGLSLPPRDEIQKVMHPEQVEHLKVQRRQREPGAGKVYVSVWGAGAATAGEILKLIGLVTPSTKFRPA